MNGPGPATAVFDGPTTAGPGRLLNKRLSSRRACARVIVPTLGCWAVVALVLVRLPPSVGCRFVSGFRCGFAWPCARGLDRRRGLGPGRG